MGKLSLDIPFYRTRPQRDVSRARPRKLPPAKVVEKVRVRAGAKFPLAAAMLVNTNTFPVDDVTYRSPLSLEPGLLLTARAKGESKPVLLPTIVAAGATSPLAVAALA